MQLLSLFWLPAVLILVVFGIAWALGFLSYHTIRRISPTHASYSSSMIQASIIVGGLYAVSVYFEIPPTFVLAIVAIFTAGVSLHMGAIIEAAVAGGVVLGSHLLAVGEQVTIGDTSGIVTKIGFANTEIQTNTQGMVTIPNSQIAGAVVVNHSRLPAIEMSLVLPFYDRHDRDRVIGILKKELEFKNLGKGSKILHDWVGGCEQYAVVVKIDNYAKRREVLSDLSLHLTTLLMDEGLPLGSVTFTKVL